MHSRIKHQTVSFRQALHGLSWAFYTQSHLQFHVFVGVFVLILGLVFQVTFLELALLVISITLVIVVELLNTSLEAAVNLVTDEWEGYAKLAKDVAAGAVLCMSLGALLIGCIIFIPRVLLVLASL